MLRPLLAAAAAALVLAAPAKAATVRRQRLLGVRRQACSRSLDTHWDEHDGYFHLGGGGSEPMSNSMLLLTYSVAAMQGHEGPARNDHRARSLADRLVRRAAVREDQPGAGPGPRARLGELDDQRRGGQHLVFDAEVVDGLVYAYRARARSAARRDRRRRSATAIHRTARGSFWRYPTIRLNQINWYALMYAADATVTGDNTLLQRDFALQLKRFFARRARHRGAAPATSAPACASTTSRAARSTAAMNLDSAEYANIVLTFTRFYDQARRAGMRAAVGLRAEAHAPVDHARGAPATGPTPAT